MLFSFCYGNSNALLGSFLIDQLADQRCCGVFSQQRANDFFWCSLRLARNDSSLRVCLHLQALVSSLRMVLNGSQLTPPSKRFRPKQNFSGGTAVLRMIPLLNTMRVPSSPRTSVSELALQQCTGAVAHFEGRTERPRGTVSAHTQHRR